MGFFLKLILALLLPYDKMGGGGVATPLVTV